MWRELTEAEWKAHLLNRLRGWMILVLVYLVIEGPLTGLTILAGALVDYGTFRSLFDPAVSDWLEWAQILVPTIGATLLLVLAFAKVRRFPELYLVLRGLAYLVAWISGGFPGISLDWLWLMQAALILVELALVWHLFAGARPNVVFKRRARTGD